MTKKIIIENVLDAKTFVQVQNHMLSFKYPWNFAEGVSHSTSTGDFQFIHNIHEGPYIDNPNDYQLVYPLLEVLQPQAIVRIKANLLINKGLIINFFNYSVFRSRLVQSRADDK